MWRGWEPIAFADRVGWVYPSRYCPVDSVAGYARTEFGVAGPDTIMDVAEFVNKRIEYLSGSSDTATNAIVANEASARPQP